ncbi:MAG: UvrD-helicase domain-containing protein [Candidatus Ratteibacteria bacterium]|nr:UvrD-helicase domain-containing protein [Candidatus Ratteibacteria bacterium]
MKAKDFNQLKFPGVDVVEASAGSGKTYALARRYLQLLMAPQLKSEESPLKTILAVTFTNKAAFEMKERILEFLKKIALDAFKNKKEKANITFSLAIGEEEAKKLASIFVDEIISHYNFFQVETIDSFIKSLLSGCAFHLRLASDFRIKEGFYKYLEYSLDRLIERAGTDRNILEVFTRFLKSYLWVENRESWLVKKDMFGLIKSLYNGTNTYGGIFRETGIETASLRKRKKTVINLIKEIADNAPEHSDGRFINALNVFLKKNRDSFNVDSLSAYFEKRHFPVKKNKEAPEEIIRLWNNLRKNLGRLCELESESVFSPYIEIFNLVLSDFKKLSGRDEIIFLPELNTLAQSLVGDESVSVAELYYRLAVRFRHYLIDEFQDTSRLQWRNLSPMINEALASGGTLFYVGDKKQAIYRFRGGNVSLFDSVKDGFKSFEPKEAVLDKNYRSQKEIIEFNNQIFSAENLKRFIKDAEKEQKSSFDLSDKDIGRVIRIFSDSRQSWKGENTYGYVRIETVQAARLDERDIIMRKRLMSLIAELKNRFSFGAMAILTRENKDVKLFTSWLIEEGIPVESEKTLNIREHPLVKEIVSFLKFLNSPIDELSFASFILGEIFQKVSGISGESIQDFLFKLRMAAEKGKGIYLYRKFRNRFPDAWESLIDEFFKSVGFVPLYELMISVFGKFKVMENFPQYQGFFMKFLELIKKREEDYAGLSSFLEFFEEIEEKELYVNVVYPVRSKSPQATALDSLCQGTSNGVKISTIHKAKGLEFPVVIIPFLELEVNVGSGVSGSRKPYLVKQFEDNSLSLIQLKKSYRAHSDKLDNEYREEYLKSLIEGLDNLYVTLTRAKYELYLFIPSKTGNRKNMARLLIPFESYESGIRREYREPVVPKGMVSPMELKKTVIRLPVSRYSDWISILKDEFIGPSKLVNRDKIARGRVLHFILSRVGNLYKQDKNACLKEAREKAGLVFPYVKKLDEYISLIQNLLDEEKFKPFFYLKEGTLFQEKEIIGSSGNTKRIDRLIITANEAWIIDYKSSKDEFEIQQEQIIGYMNIVKSLYPGLKVKCFLIYLDTLSIEEITS